MQTASINRFVPPESVIYEDRYSPSPFLYNGSLKNSLVAFPQPESGEETTPLPPSPPQSLTKARLESPPNHINANERNLSKISIHSNSPLATETVIYRTILQICFSDDIALLERLFDPSSDNVPPFSVLTQEDGDGITPLMFSCNYGSQNVTKWMCRRKCVNLNAQDARGDTAMHYAAANGNARCIEILLVYGADSSIPNSDGIKTFQMAAFNGHLNVVKLMISFGERGINHKDNTGKTALMLASYKGHNQIVSVLLQRRGTKTKSFDNNGWSALTLAVFSGQIAVCYALLHHDFEKNALLSKSHLSKAKRIAVANGFREVSDVITHYENLASSKVSDTCFSKRSNPTHNYTPATNSKTGNSLDKPSFNCDPENVRSVAPSLFGLGINVKSQTSHNTNQFVVTPEHSNSPPNEYFTPRTGPVNPNSVVSDGLADPLLPPPLQLTRAPLEFEANTVPLSKDHPLTPPSSSSSTKSPTGAPPIPFIQVSSATFSGPYTHKSSKPPSEPNSGNPQEPSPNPKLSPTPSPKHNPSPKPLPNPKKFPESRSESIRFPEPPSRSPKLASSPNKFTESQYTPKNSPEKFPEPASSPKNFPDPFSSRKKIPATQQQPSPKKLPASQPTPN
ncbi:Ankyrin repeat domain-containing protein 17, partial [Smittium mucronatum]